jgi:hypothetical protein
MRRTEATSTTGRYGVVVLAGALIAANGFTIFGPPPDSAAFLAVLGLVSYSAFAGVAFWFDRKRV